MLNGEDFPARAAKLPEFHALVAAAPTALDGIPGAVYLCNHEGWLVRYNSEAAALRGRAPNLDGTKERFCGSHRLFLVDGDATAAWGLPSGERCSVWRRHEECRGYHRAARRHRPHPGGPTC